MPRTLATGLKTLMDTGAFNAYLKANLIVSGNSNIVDVLRYKLTPTTMSLDVPTNYTSLYPAYVQIRRGAYLSGVATYISTSKFFIKTKKIRIYKDKLISLHIEASLFPENKFSIAGDNTYQNVISSFCTEFGKTAVFDHASDPYWQYQFLPTGKSVSLNNAMQFLNMLQQKYFIFAADNGNDQVLFYHGMANHEADIDYQMWYEDTGQVALDANDIIAKTPIDLLYKPLATRAYRAVDENGTLRTGGTANSPVHNLGYLESTDSFPELSEERDPYSWKTGITLYPLSGDIVHLDPDHIAVVIMPVEVIEEFAPDAEIVWSTTIKQTEVFSNTAGGALPSTIERVANYTPLNTTNFDTILSAENNNVQSAFDKLDDHDHSGLATTEGIQDIIGAMVSTNTETGIAVTYDDTNGKLNFDAQTAGDARYAPIANGVTNGDSHDHNGGDGGTVAYTSLSSKPTAETNTNDIFRCSSPGGSSTWAGTFTAAGSSGSTIKYATTSGNAGAMTPASTSQLAKMRLYNTTRGNSVLISNHVAGTITSTAAYPGNWANGDVLTIASQTVSGGTGLWVDLEITASLTGKSNVFMNLLIYSATAGDFFKTHPFETYADSKVINLVATTVNQASVGMYLIKVTSNVFTMGWSGSVTFVILREVGYLE